MKINDRNIFLKNRMIKVLMIHKNSILKYLIYFSRI